jgi:hypothetical protein
VTHGKIFLAITSADAGRWDSICPPSDTNRDLDADAKHRPTHVLFESSAANAYEYRQQRKITAVNAVIGY